MAQCAEATGVAKLKNLVNRGLGKSQPSVLKYFLHSAVEKKANGFVVGFFFNHFPS